MAGCRITRPTPTSSHLSVIHWCTVPSEYSTVHRHWTADRLMLDDVGCGLLFDSSCPMNSGEALSFKGWLKLIHVHLDDVCLCVWCGNKPLTSARQHPSYGDCLEFKREYYQNCSVLDCVTQCWQSAVHLHEQFLQVLQIGFVTLGPLRYA